jgi:AcrR family transcriptional regulator
MPDRAARLQAIVASAIELLDDQGLEGLSMRHLAERTGNSATSVYWYVKNKDELVALTLDTVITEVDLPDIDAVGWRGAAAGLARDFRAMMLRHPWLGLVTATYPNAAGRQLARHSEHILAVYEAAGFTDEDVDHAVAAVYSYTLGASIGEVGAAAWRPGDNPSTELTGEALAKAHAAAEGLPRLTTRIDALAGADHATIHETAFEFGLQAVLDGLAQRLGR